MSNVSFSRALLKKLWKLDVREFCVAAGSRNSPLLYALSKTPDFKTWTFYDEREAGFFALGRIIESGRPVAVLTTSGTAAAELFPAVIEAHYSNLPLLCLTADRPLRYRGTGAPQAIEQKNLYGVYTEKYFELGTRSSNAQAGTSGGAPSGFACGPASSGESAASGTAPATLGSAPARSGDSAWLDRELSQIFESVSLRKPIHFNLFFDEPLIDGELPEIGFSDSDTTSVQVAHSTIHFEAGRRVAASSLRAPPKKTQGGTLSIPLPKAYTKNFDKIPSLNSALKEASRPLLLLGSLPDQARAAVKAFALKLQAPLYIEALSGLREDADLLDLSITSSERIFKKNLPDLVLRIGGVPTCRFWRDLENLSVSLRVFSIDEKEFSGMVGSTHIEGNIESALSEIKITPAPSELKIATPRTERSGAVPQVERQTTSAQTRRASAPLGAHQYARALKTLDQEFAAKKAELFSRFPKSEPSVFAYLSRVIPPGSNIFLGNSLSVREWDLCAATRSKNFSYFANRGANGIDGELSTFFGGLKANVTNVAILGDLTALYSLSAPWVARELEDKKFLIFVVNNAGGKIFSRLPAHKHFKKAGFEKLMELKHSTTFRAWAELWNLGYTCWNGEESGLELPAFDRGIMELKPDANQTDAFWAAFDEQWK